MRVIVVIPARYASTRLPGKPLLDICGKPMLRRVWEIAMAAKCPQRVIIATDDQRIMDRASGWGADVLMTSPSCQSGTDRLIETAEKIEADIYVNMQGDEPLMKAEAIDRLVEIFSDPSVQVASLRCSMTPEEAKLPQNVKVVTDHKNNALYFSRALIPFPRDKDCNADFWRHLGIYAYRRDALRRFASLPPSPLEKIECLEQLRFLQAGIPIRMADVEPMGGGVDTEEDLEKTRCIIGAAQPYPGGIYNN